MSKGWIITVALLAGVVSAVAVILFAPNSLGRAIIDEAKSMGYIAYTPEEATTLAYERCSTCHTEEKMLKYCTRCGPPFIVVVHFMKKYTEITNAQNKDLELKQFSDAEIVAIAQAWNALIGNWESDWPEEDLRRLLDEDQALIDLLATPVEHRPIEAALKDKRAPGSYRRYGLGTSDDQS
ncbi:MAG: hypothetical protein GY791_00640 [Alphaproteobacteria bacterium]|nr:hypothetical protein [Alphaproteobacteria bacterium]